MSWRVFTGLLFLYLVIVLLSGVMTEVYTGGNATTIVSLILAPPMPSYSNPIGGITQTISVSSTWISAFLSAMWLDFPAVFSGPYVIIRIFLLTVFGGIVAFQVFSGIKPS